MLLMSVSFSCLLLSSLCSLLVFLSPPISLSLSLSLSLFLSLSCRLTFKHTHTHTYIHTHTHTHRQCYQACGKTIPPQTLKVRKTKKRNCVLPSGLHIEDI